MSHRGCRILFASILPLVCVLAACARAAPKPVATLTESDGDVTVIRAADADEEDGEEDMDLFEGDAIKTAAGAKVTITFLDNHLIKLSERSSLVLKTVRVNAATGSLWGQVKLIGGKLFASFTKLSGSSSGFRVETRTAVAAVKGTTFSVEDADDASTVSVLEGTVATAGLDAAGRETGAVDVPEGQETSVDLKGRRPGKPRGFLKEGRRAWVVENLRDVRTSAERHRELKRSGELFRQRRMRNLARASYLLELQRTDPDALDAMPPGRRARLKEFLATHQRDLTRSRDEVRRYLDQHPEAREKLQRQSERRMRGRGGERGGRARPDRPRKARGR